MSPATPGGFVCPPGQEPEIVLRRCGPRQFRLETPFRYQDAELGTITVPADTAIFDTDLASVPWISAWYVSPLGRHVPAAVLHDALVCDPGVRTYSTRDGHTVSRAQADRVFLDALTALGTPRIRRLVMWSGVSLATIGGWRRNLWYLLAFVLGGALTVALFGRYGWGRPLVGDAWFPLRWARAAIVEFAVMTAVGPLLFGPRNLKMATVQAALYGLTFLPTLLMMPAVAILVGPRALRPDAPWPD